MTIREKILNLLNSNPVNHYTNRDISGILGIPEPSVRRATKALVDLEEVTRTIGGAYKKYSPEHTTTRKPTPRRKQAAPPSGYKQYVGIVTDHSASMRGLQRGACDDFNRVVDSIRDGATRHGIDTLVSTVEFGVGGGWYSAGVERKIVNSNVNMLQHRHSYTADGGSTPLYDGVGDMLRLMEYLPDAHDKNVAFLIYVITDGLENSSHTWSAGHLRAKIMELQATDRWTITFRTPRGYANALATRLNIPRGNILEWDQTDEGLDLSSRATIQATDSYFTSRSKGVASSRSFYANVGHIDVRDFEDNLGDITNQAKVWDVSKYSNTAEIRTYVEGKNINYLKGAAFYQLTKSETVQPYKQLIIMDRVTNKLFAGNAARKMLGVNVQGDIKLRPGDHGRYNIFIQSTSVNRKLVGGTKLVYWPQAVQGQL